VAADSAAVIEHLRRQRAAVLSRLDEMRDLVSAIDQALEKEMSGMKLTQGEQKELFGNGFCEEYADEAEQRWGQTEAWKQSQRRTSKYTRQDWVQIKAEMDATNAVFVAAMDVGQPAAGVEAMDAAERHRLHIQKWFYDICPELHRGLGDMYIADPRFTKDYEDIRAGMAQYVRDAIHANADRAGTAGKHSQRGSERTAPSILSDLRGLGVAQSLPSRLLLFTVYKIRSADPTPRRMGARHEIPGLSALRASACGGAGGHCRRHRPVDGSRRLLLGNAG